MIAKGRPLAPKGTGPAGKRLWADIVNVYGLNPAELETLRHAAQTADLIARIEAELAEADGLQVAGSEDQPRPHPLLAAVATQRRTLATLLRHLALPVEGEKVGKIRTPEEAARAKGRAYGSPA